MRIVWTGLLLTAALAGCARNPPLDPNGGVAIVDPRTALPPPGRTDLTAADRPALIGPLDTIQVDVFSVPELSREMQVNVSGGISMPLIGTIDAGGKTAPELARDIEASLRGRYVRSPQVTVNIKNSVSQVVTVDGQVVQPGLYPVTNQTTLMRAVASARGLNEFARLEEVVILRTVEGQRMAALYDLAAIRRGAYADPAIYANDVIVVGDSPQRRLLSNLRALSPFIVAPLVAVLR